MAKKVCTPSIVTNSQPVFEHQYASQASLPIFSQFVNVCRPHTLLTEDVESSGTLQYRYGDTQEVVTVPNVRLNQPGSMRVAFLLGQAAFEEAQVNDWMQRVPGRVTKAQAMEHALEHREKAHILRTQADRLTQADSEAHPVATSRLYLGDYSHLLAA